MYSIYCVPALVLLAKLRLASVEHAGPKGTDFQIYKMPAFLVYLELWMPKPQRETLTLIANITSAFLMPLEK